MQISDITDYIEFPMPKTKREPGIHVSDLIQFAQLKEDKKRCAFDRMPEDTKKIFRAKFANGLLFETALSHSLATWFEPVRPKPIQVDGIWCSPDGIIKNFTFMKRTFSPVVVFESKYSMKKAAFNEKSFHWWIVQIKAYCFAVNSTIGILASLHPMGDYLNHIYHIAGKKHTIYPNTKFKTWLLEFTEKEIYENWNLLLELKEQYKKEKERDLNIKKLICWLNSFIIRKTRFRKNSFLPEQLTKKNNV